MDLVDVADHLHATADALYLTHDQDVLLSQTVGYPEEGA